MRRQVKPSGTVSRLKKCVFQAKIYQSVFTLSKTHWYWNKMILWTAAMLPLAASALIDRYDIRPLLHG